MIYSVESSVSVNEIIASAKLQLDDKDTIRFTPGWYVSKAQRAMTELSLDTLFFEVEKDLEFPSDTLSLDVPSNCFNLKEIYVMNVDSDNAIREIRNVYWKREYRTNGSGKKYTSTQRPLSDSTEPYIDIFGSSTEVFNPSSILTESNMFYFSVSNGRIQFSSNCSGYSRVRLVFNGLHTELGDVPLIPQMFQTVVEDYIVEEGMKVLKAEDPSRWRALWSDVNNTLYGGRNGTWVKAERRAKKLDHKTRRDMLMYNAKMNTNG